MMKAQVTDLGTVGLIEDKEPTALPPNAWTDLSNARCVDRSIASFSGYESIATTTELPETMTTVETGQQTYIVYCGNDTIYSVRSGVETSIGTGFTTPETWDSTVLGGIGVFTNFSLSNNPQYWGGSGNTVDLPYDESGTETCLWTDVGFRAKIIRAYRGYLVAMNIEDCDGYNPRKVHWSHVADPGTVPITWDPTLAEYDAGFTELWETPGPILDAALLRDTLQIYKSDGIWSVTWQGRFSATDFVFRFRNVTTSKGLYARGCVSDVGGRHFFVADGDIYIYDGTNFQSIADERVKNYFFDSVSKINKDKTFTIYYERTKEVWLCFPTANQESCNKALVWDSIRNVWSRRDLPGVTAGVFGVVDRSSGWDYADGDGNGPYTYGTQWDASITTYGAFIDNNPFKESLILGGATDFYEMDRGNQADGVNQTCYAQRTHSDLGDKQDWHMILTIYPRAEGDPFDVRIGSMEVTGETPTWSSYQTFTPGTDYKLDFRVSGRLHAIEFYSDTNVAWNIEAYELDYELVARR